MIIFRHESFPFSVAKLVKGYEEWQGESVLRFPDEVFDKHIANHWMKQVMLDLKPNQKRPFVLAADEGRKTRPSDDMLRQSKCSFVLFEPQWFRMSDYEWAWKVLKAWPDILDKCRTAYEINQQCKLSVSVNGKIAIHNL